MSAYLTLTTAGSLPGIDFSNVFCWMQSVGIFSFVSPQYLNPDDLPSSSPGGDIDYSKLLSSEVQQDDVVETTISSKPEMSPLQLEGICRSRIVQSRASIARISLVGNSRVFVEKGQILSPALVFRENDLRDGRTYARHWIMSLAIQAAARDDVVLFDVSLTTHSRAFLSKLPGLASFTEAAVAANLSALAELGGRLSRSTACEFIDLELPPTQKSKGTDLILDKVRASGKFRGNYPAF